MSRESLLDEAIIKAKECGDWQLVEWLRMARGGESAARWYSDKLRDAHRIERKLMDENAKLRKLVAAMPYCMEARCLECPMCSPFDTSIGGVPECRASWKLSALGVEVDDGAR